MAEPRPFRMPSLGADMTEGSVIEWLVQPGDRVHRGDLVAVVKTDKADVEVEIYDEGVVAELLLPAGGPKVPVGTPIATIADAGTPPPAAPTPTRPGAEPSQTITATIKPPPHPPTATRAPAAGEPGLREPVASPFARRRAVELGVDLAQVVPARPGHPIEAADVERAAAGRAPAPTPPTEATTSGSEPGDAAAAMRRAIGNLMARSKREIPHYYLADDIDFTHTRAWLTHHNEQVPVTQRILPAALLYKAVALALREEPELNGHWNSGAFLPGRGIHLGIAIALRGGGLIAPAIHDADELPLPELMTKLRDLTARARGGRLRGSEMTDATVTVTNLGDQGVREVFGVIYPPQVALVGFGKVTDRVWASDDGIAVKPVVTATLSADHRATDGHIGARFLNAIARLLHAPEEL